MGAVYLPSQVAVMVNMVKGGRLANPRPLTSLGLFLHHEGIYARKWLLFVIWDLLSDAIGTKKVCLRLWGIFYVYLVGGRFQTRVGCHFSFFL